MAYIIYREGFGVYISKTIASESKTGIKAFFNKGVLPQDDDFVFRWGTTSNVPGEGRKIINNAKAIHKVYDKRVFRSVMAGADLAPRTFLTLADYLKDAVGEEECPVIVRKAAHERSEDLTLCHTPAQVAEVCEGYGKGNYYISEYIKKDREFRVFVCQGKVVWMIEKFPKNKNDVTWGCVEEGRFEYIGWSEWPLFVVENVLKAFNLSNLHFGAVDVIVQGDKAYSLEINTGPEVTPYYIRCIAKCFDYIVTNKSGKRMETEKFSNWRDVIHPAIGG